MDAYVQLALIEKAKRVFTNAETFLSFPLLAPFSFSPEQVAAINAPQSAADYATAADFARIVNFIPRDIVATVDGESFLWDVYEDVLDRAEVASGNTSAAADTAAAATLYVTSDDGSRAESPAYKEYRQYRDAWIAAQEDYTAQSLSADSLTGDARAQWSDVEEPALRAAIAAAEAAWEQQGRKAEIEAALLSADRVSATDPRLSWREWQNDFNPDIDMISDPTSGGRYAPTGYSPRDLSGDDAWLHFDLSSAEMATLVAEAPANLRVVLTDNSASDFEHVAFDYRSVGIMRPWFHSEVFKARTWRTPEERPLSDGGSPPSGRCPAYVAALVFVRNVSITRRANDAAPPVPGDLRFTLQPSLLTNRPLILDKALIARMQVAPTQRPVKPEPPVPATGQPQLAFRRLSQQSFNLATVAKLRTAVRPAPVLRSPATAIRPRIDITRLGPSLFRPVRPAPPPKPTAPAPPFAPAPSQDVSILAFICKWLPKAPDPSADFKWS